MRFIYTYQISAKIDKIPQQAKEKNRKAFNILKSLQILPSIVFKRFSGS